MSETSKVSLRAKTALKIAGVSLLAVLVVLGASGALTSHQQFPASGQIAGVGVEIYSDPGLMTPMTHIDWGIVRPGASVNHIAYVKNAGNVPCTLSLSVGNWTPAEAPSYISVTWDSEDVSVEADGHVQVVIYLTVSDSVQGIDQFTSLMTITGVSV